MKNLKRFLVAIPLVLVALFLTTLLAGCESSNDNVKLNDKIQQLAEEGKYAGMISNKNQTLEVDVTNNTEIIFVVSNSSIEEEISIECETQLDLEIQHLLTSSEPYEFVAYETDAITTGYSTTLGSGIYKIKVKSGLDNKSDVLKIICK